jgi:hypothetical protein
MIACAPPPRPPIVFGPVSRMALPTGCAARHPVRGSFLAITLCVRHVAVEREVVAREQVPDIVPDGEPHLALNNARPHRERVGVRLENRPRRPPSLDNFVESLRARLLQMPRK